MSEKQSYKATASEFYAPSSASLHESIDEIKEFLFETNNYGVETGVNENQSENSPNDVNESQRSKILNLDDSRFPIDQSVINSILSSSEKNKDILVQNYQNKEKNNLENPHVLNLVNIDQELIQNNKKIRIIENAFTGINRLETNFELNKDKINENQTSNNPDINFINIDKDYINSNEPGSITIIQNVPLLIINHNCCDSESCKLSDSKSIKYSLDNKNIEITTLSTSYKNTNESDKLQFKAETKVENLEGEGEHIEGEDVEGEVIEGEEIEGEEEELEGELEEIVEFEGEIEEEVENKENDTNQILNKDLETTLANDNNAEENTETLENRENGSNRSQDNENTHDNSWSITSFHQYEEVAVEEDTETKSSSQESSIHLGENNEANNISEIVSDDEAKKFSSLKNKIDEMLAKLDKKNQESFISNKTDQDEKTSDKSIQESEKSLKIPKKSKSKESDDTDSDDTCKDKKSKKSKSKESDDSDSDDSDSDDSDSDDTDSDDTCKGKKSKKTKCKESDDTYSDDTCKGKKSKKPKCKESDDTYTDDTWMGKIPKKPKYRESDDTYTDDTWMGKTPKNKSKPYSAQGCPQTENISSPLVDSIDRIKNLLSDILFDMPNQQDNSRKNTCPNQPNDKNTIKFIFPQINLKQPDNACKKFQKTPSSKLPSDDRFRKNNCFTQNKKQQGEPIWVLTRVTKHITRTVRRESVPCP